MDDDDEPIVSKTTEDSDTEDSLSEQVSVERNPALEATGQDEQDGEESSRDSSDSLFEHRDNEVEPVEEVPVRRRGIIGNVASAVRSAFSRAASSASTSSKQPPSQMSIFAFTWNTESVLIAETLQRNGQEPVSFYSEKWLGCRQADFLPDLVHTHIFGEDDGAGKHHLIIMALQESAKPGDYLLSHTFGNQLGERYVLVKRGRMMGIGRTTLNALRKEGAVRARGLRLAVYARKDFAPFVHFQAEKSVPSTMQDHLTRGKGGYGIVLRVDGFGLMAFLNIHLPFTASTLAHGNHSRLATGVRQQDEAFCNILEQFLSRRALHHLFVLGDLNYRVLNPGNIVDSAGLCAAMATQPEFRQRIYDECDELRQSLNSCHLPLPFQEGIDNQGPQFMPTAKMQHSREPGSTTAGAYKYGRQNFRNASWCDRILYLPGTLQKAPTISQLVADTVESRANDSYEYVGSNEPAVCTLYDRFESGKTMTKSDHSAVVAYFVIKR
jgi:hypothetical protein